MCCKKIQNCWRNKKYCGVALDRNLKGHLKCSIFLKLELNKARMLNKIKEIKHYEQ